MKSHFGTPRSPKSTSPFSSASHGRTLSDGLSAKDGGEGTFLGQCHLSIQIDGDEESGQSGFEHLATYHKQNRELDIRIGKNRAEPGTPTNDEDQKSSGGKLKFKVYTTALAAYLKYGKNYGDELRKEELVDVLIVDT